MNFSEKELSWQLRDEQGNLQLDQTIKYGTIAAALRRAWFGPPPWKCNYCD